MAVQTKKKKKKAKKKTNNRAVLWRKVALAAAVVALLATVITVSALHRTQRKPPATVTLDKPIAAGIDVSRHNGRIDWKKVSNAVDFAFVRVGFRGYTKGEICYDETADYNLRYANKAGVPVGVYFYSQAVNETEAEEEAAFVLDAIKHYEIALPVVIDFEYAFVSGKHGGRLYDAHLSTEQRTALVNAFCSKIRTAGYIPGVYASSFVFRTELNVKAIPDDVYIWVADYNPVMTYTGRYDIHQYSESGSCDGVNENVDMNYFYTQNRQ